MYIIRDPVHRGILKPGTSERLEKLKQMTAISTLLFKDLTHKLVRLVALVSAQRGQTLHLLKIKHMTKTEPFYSFTITELTKQTRQESQRH